MGKGGVGRTTVAATLGLLAAQQRKKTLIAMCNAAETLSPLLECPPITDIITKVDAHLDVVNMVPKTALQEYGRMVVRPHALYSVIFENKKTLGFLLAIPGMEAWAMLGKAWFHTQNYDLVIVDMPSSGVALDMLRVPKALVELAPKTLLSREALSAMELFQNRNASSFEMVTLPEATPVQEALETAAQLKDELSISISSFIVNQTVEMRLSAFAQPSDGTLPEAIAPIFEERLEREREQIRQVEKLRSHTAKLIEVPKIFDSKVNKNTLEARLLPLFEHMS